MEVIKDNPARNSLESEIFRMSLSEMNFQLLHRRGRGLIVFFSMILIGIIIAGFLFADLRLHILALMLLFLIIPTLLMIIYFRYALDPAVAFNILPHRIWLDGEGIFAIIYRLKADDEDKKRGVERGKRGEEKDMMGEKEYEIAAVREIVLEYPVKYYVGTGSVIIPFLAGDAGKRGGFLYLPRKAFDSQSEYVEFIKAIVDRKER